MNSCFGEVPFHARQPDQAEAFDVFPLIFSEQKRIASSNERILLVICGFFLSQDMTMTCKFMCKTSAGFLGG